MSTIKWKCCTISTTWFFTVKLHFLVGDEKSRRDTHKILILYCEIGCDVTRFLSISVLYNLGLNLETLLTLIIATHTDFFFRSEFAWGNQGGKFYSVVTIGLLDWPLTSNVLFLYCASFCYSLIIILYWSYRDAWAWSPKWDMHIISLIWIMSMLWLYTIGALEVITNQSRSDGKELTPILYCTVLRAKKPCARSI